MRSARNAGRTPCWAPPLTTPSAAKTPARRLAVLSEMPEEWARQVQAWSRILRARRGDVEGTAPPDRNDEYLFYQFVFGAWPADLTGIEEPGPEKLRAFAERLEGAMVKSIREAKLRSTWASPNTAYEEAVVGFVREAFDVSRPNAFLSAFLPFQGRVARLGARNSLVQTALKLTLPGMPDIYQGAELWDLSRSIPTTGVRWITESELNCSKKQWRYWSETAAPRCSTCLKIGPTAVSNWPSSLPCWPTAAIIRCCLHMGDMSRLRLPAPKPTRCAPLLVATKGMRWSSRRRAFPCAARPNRIGVEPRSLGRRRRARDALA